MLEHAAETANGGNRERSETHFVGPAAHVTQPSPWPARGMRHDRPRSGVRPGVTYFVVPVLDELRVRAARIDVENGDVRDKPASGRIYA
jgi:hypothetical protein